MRQKVRPRRPCRMISWPAANGMRWLNPSSAIVLPSRTSDAIASGSGRTLSFAMSFHPSSVNCDPDRLSQFRRGIQC